MPGDLLDLPQELVGIIYSKLPDAACRQALFSSCSAMRSNPSIVSQLSRLTIKRDQLRTSEICACNPLASKLGRSLQLRILIIEETLDNGALLELLRPAEEGIRAAVSHTLQSLQEFQLRDWDLSEESASSPLGCIVATLPSLCTFRVAGSFSRVSSEFLGCLTRGRPAQQLRCLDLSSCFISREHIPAICGLKGLVSLAVTTQSLTHIADISSLQQLRELSIRCISLQPHGHGSLTWVGKLSNLQKLTLPLVPAHALPVLQEFPASLECLKLFSASFGNVQGLLQALAQSTDWLPRLQCIELKHLMRKGFHFYPEHRVWPSTRPQLQMICHTVDLGNIRADDDSVWIGFLDACEQAPPHFASSIQAISASGHVPVGLCGYLELCTSLTKLSLNKCGTNGIRRVRDSLRYMPGLSSILFRFSRYVPRAGLGAALMALCVEAAFLPGADRREITVDIDGSDWELLAGEEELEEDDSIHTELAVFQQSWRSVHSHLSRCPTVCKVEVKYGE